MSVGSVAHAPTPSAADCLRQVDKIVNSEVLRGSETLRNLLRFLAQRSIEHPGERIPVQEIATQVFRRPADFDSQTDSVVRVHAGRLRSKLAEYAIGQGARDDILVEMPRGGYELVFRYRSAADPSEKFCFAAAAPTVGLKGRRGLAVAAVTGAVVGLMTGFLVFRNEPPAPPAPLRTLWRDFIGSGSEPLVIFSTPRFVGSHLTGMRYYQSPADSGQPVIDTYTGISEVFAVHALTNTFALFRRSLPVQRGQTVTWDDARSRHLILLGGPDANQALRDMPRLEEFHLKGPATEPNRGIGAVIIQQPRPGEQKILWGPAARPYDFDYGIVALVPGLSPGRRVMVLAGITTLGTQAAAEFVCREQSVAGLLAALGVKHGAAVPSFEALLKVRGSGGVPVESRLLSWRIRKSEN